MDTHVIIVIVDSYWNSYRSWPMRQKKVFFHFHFLARSAFSINA